MFSFVSENILVLLILLPLLASLVSFAFNNGLLSFVTNIFIAGVTNVMAFTVFYDVFYGNKIVPMSYNVGGWMQHIGIELLATPLSVVVLTMVHVAYFCAVLFSYPNWKYGGRVLGLSLFYTLLSLFATGLSGILLSNDAFNIFVFLEVSSIAGYAMVSMGKQRDSSVASFDYLIVGAVGASFYLLGVGIIYLDTGLLNISMIRIIPKHSETAMLAFTFIIIGLAVKTAVFPLHVWLMKAYRFAPPYFGMFSGAVFTKVMVLVMYKMFVNMEWHADVPINPRTIVIYLGMSSMFFGAWAACLQKDWRSIIACSSVSQVGYIMVALGMKSFFSVESALLIIFAHTIIQIALFAASGVALSIPTENDELNFGFLSQKSSLIWLSVVILLASVVGIPGTAGFLSKWLLVQSAIHTKSWMVLGCILVSSAISVKYCVKLVEQITQKNISISGNDMLCKSSWFMNAFFMISGGIAVIVMGLYTKPIGKIGKIVFASIL